MALTLMMRRVSIGAMLSRSVLVLCCSILPVLSVGCGESDSDRNEAPPGQDRTSSGRTTGCPRWPAEKLILRPFGPFFYGTETGPCRSSIREGSGRRVTEKFYVGADGQLESISRSSDTVSSDYDVFTWVNGVPKIELIHSNGESYATSTFSISPEEVVETSVRTDGNSSHQYACALTAEGYPSTMAQGPYTPENGSSTVELYSRFVYEDCRIQKICIGTSAEELLDCRQHWAYAYDASGRVSVVDHSATLEAMTFDYCDE